MTAGEKIRYIRESKNMTQGELAEVLGLKSKSAVSRTEASGDKLTTKTILKYAEALGVSPVDIISEEKEVSPAEIERELKKANNATLRRISAYIDYLLAIRHSDPEFDYQVYDALNKNVRIDIEPTQRRKNENNS